MKPKSKQRREVKRDIMDQARAAGCWLNSERNPRTGEIREGEELAAFMAIFHPNIKGKKLKALLNPHP